MAFYELDASLAQTTGPASLADDMTNTLLPAWSEVVTGSPRLIACTAPCTEDVMVKAVAAGDPNLGGAYSNTIRDGGFTSGTPAYFVHQSLYFRIKYYDHGLANGGAGSSNDDRPLLAHELVHTLGLGHCDTNAGMSVMCAAFSTASSELNFEGNHYWTPRPGDLQALGLLY
ncbi:MAG: hypothetical protein U0838_03405 [Chloroflexota bacterium]